MIATITLNMIKCEESRPMILTFLSYLFIAWTPSSSDLPLCGGHMFGRGGPSGPQGIPTDVPQSAATQCPGGPNHIRTHGPGSRAKL